MWCRDSSPWWGARRCGGRASQNRCATAVGYGTSCWKWSPTRRAWRASCPVAAHGAPATRATDCRAAIGGRTCGGSTGVWSAAAHWWAPDGWAWHGRATSVGRGTTCTPFDGRCCSVVGFVAAHLFARWVGLVDECWGWRRTASRGASFDQRAGWGTTSPRAHGGSAHVGAARNTCDESWWASSSGQSRSRGSIAESASATPTRQRTQPLWWASSHQRNGRGASRSPRAGCAFDAEPRADGCPSDWSSACAQCARGTRCGSVGGPPAAWRACACAHEWRGRNTVWFTCHIRRSLWWWRG
jgi:hypothetical protein